MSVFTNNSSSTPEERGQYVPAVLELLGNRDPMDVLRRTPEALRRGIDGLAEAELRQPEAPGKWSIGHVLRHLADSDLVWAWRLRMVLAHDRPALTGYDQDLWATRLHYGESDPNAAMQLFTVVRGANLALLDGASGEDLRRVGLHAERGEESIERMVALYAGHDLLHVRQIERIRAAVSTPGSSRGR